MNFLIIQNNKTMIKWHVEKNNKIKEKFGRLLNLAAKTF